MVQYWPSLFFWIFKWGVKTLKFVNLDAHPKSFEYLLKNLEKLLHILKNLTKFWKTFPHFKKLLHILKKTPHFEKNLQKIEKYLHFCIWLGLPVLKRPGCNPYKHSDLFVLFNPWRRHTHPPHMEKYFKCLFCVSSQTKNLLFSQKFN